MENNCQQRDINSQKISKKKLNGRFAFLGVFDIDGAYVSTRQIIPGIV